MTRLYDRDPSAGRWPTRWPVWTITAILVAVLIFFAGLYYRYQRAWEPLQRIYLSQYLSGEVSSWLGVKERNYEFLHLVKPRGSEAWALNADVVQDTNRSGRRELLPSDSARQSGVLRLESGPGRYPVKPTQSFMREQIYGGSVWSLAVRPGLGALVALVVGLYLAIPKDWKRARERRHGRRLRGPEFVAADEFNRRISRRGHGVGMGIVNVPDPDARNARRPPTIWIPESRLSTHFLLMGDTGAGKSSLLLQMLMLIRRREDAAIIYDPTPELTQLFFSSDHDVILNPLDARMPYWTIGDEIERGADTMAVASSLFPGSDYSDRDEDFFIEKARDLFAHLLGHRPRPEQLVRWLADPDEIDRRVLGTTHAMSIAQSAPGQRVGVLASLNRAANAFRDLPAESETKARWNVADWAKERSGWLFLTATHETRDRLRMLTSLWLDMLALHLLEPREGARRVWFVLDELASLQKLPKLHRLVTEGRKAGNPVVIGFQGRSQIEKRYGRDAETLLSQPSTKVFLKTSEPQAAKWISDAIGTVQIERWQESRSKGSQHRDSQSHASQFVFEPLVTDSQISGLQEMHGYLKLDNFVTPLNLFRPSLPEVAPGFIPRAARSLKQPSAPAPKDEDPFFE